MSRRDHITRHDTQVVLTVDLSDRPTQQPIDVSGAAVVRMYLRAEGGDVILDTVVATKLPGQTLSDGTLDGSITTPGGGGRVQFALPLTFTAREPGYYEGEIEITLSAGTIQTVYDIEKLSIRDDF